MTTIRPMTVDDLPAVVELEGSHQPRPWSLDVFLSELEADNRVYLIVVDKGVVGFGGVMVIGDEAHITNLLVDPEVRGRGLGRQLMVDLIEAAASRGARHLTLEVRSKNHPARSLYAGLGMAPVGIRTGYYGEDDAVIMWAHDIDAPSFIERLR